MIFSRALLATFVVFESLVSAHVLGYHDARGYSFENDWREVLVDLQPRQSSDSGPSCRAVCGSCGSSCTLKTKKRRGLLDGVTDNSTYLDELDVGDDSHQLSKRTLRAVRQSQIASYLDGKTDALQNPAENPDSNLISLAYEEDDNDFSYATLKKFSDFSANILNIGTAGLTGCTVLTVVSSKAVYSGHFFESLAWDPDEEYEIDTDQAFQENCLNLITGSGVQWETKGDAIDPSLFTGYNPVAIIMTPRVDQDDPTEDNPNPAVPGPETQKYQAKVQQLVTTLQGLIDGLTVLYYNYIAMDLEDYEFAYQGVALFEYDPSADANGNANFRVWCESATEDAWSMGIIKDPNHS